MEQDNEIKKFKILYPSGGSKILTDKTIKEAQEIARRENDPSKGEIKLVEITEDCGGVVIDF